MIFLILLVREVCGQSANEIEEERLENSTTRNLPEEGEGEKEIGSTCVKALFLTQCNKFCSTSLEF